MKVEIYKLNNDGSQSVVATCSLESDKVMCRGDSETLRYLEQGIGDPETDELLYPKDGVRFLAVLKTHFKSGYLSASAILS